jgi:lysozyme family protein
MANFEIALKYALSNENNPSTSADDYVSANKDKIGGETYKGISRNYNKYWAGWKIIDQYKNNDAFPLFLNELEDLQKEVTWLYRHKYWNMICGDSIKDQRLANKFFDATINIMKAIFFMQQSLNSVRGKIVEKETFSGPYILSVDGVVGKYTIQALNSLPVNLIIDEFKERLKTYYETHAPDEFKKGLINRALKG